MTSNKYIVKNCPAITEYKFPDKVHKDCCQCRYGYCKDIDCIIKQVIELCKHYKKHSDCGRDCPSFGRFLNKLLNKFDIEE